MKGIFKLLLLNLFISHCALAGNIVKYGTLQAYWLPEWHNNINFPNLQLRFIVDNENGSYETINLETSKISHAFIIKNFMKVSDEFFEYKEGHVDQYGMLELDNLKVTTECDNNVYRATFINFTAQQINKALVDKGCDSYPWLITLRLKQGIQESELFTQPESGSQSAATVSAQTPLVKIKTINKEWIYVANYDESQPDLTGSLSGYIPANRLEPVY